MAETELQVILSLRDELSAGMKKAQNGVKSFQKDAQDLSTNMKHLSGELRQAGMAMTFMGAALTGPLLLAFKNAAKDSQEVTDTIKRLSTITREFQLTIATNLVPIMEKFSNVLKGLLDRFNVLSPAMQQAIIQGIFLTGIGFLLVGVSTSLIGKILKLTSVLIDLGPKLMVFAVVHPYILAITLAVAALILFMDKLGSVATPVLNFLQIGASNAAIAFLRFTEGINNALAGILSKIPGMQGWADEFSRGAERNALLIGEIQSRIDNIKTTGTGELANEFNNIANIVSELKNSLGGLFTDIDGPTTDLTAITQQLMDFKETIEAAMEQTNNLGKQTADIVLNTVSTLSKGIGNAFSQMIVYGKNFGDSMKLMAKDLAAQFISSVVEMIVQWALMQAIQIAFMPLIVGLATTTATALAAIWAPVAAAVSLATLGANATPAAAAIASVTALATAAAIPKIAEGGIVTRPTLALIGEAGPEAVIPLGRSGSGNNINIVMENVSFSNENDIEDIMTRLGNLITMKTRSKI